MCRKSTELEVFRSVTTIDTLEPGTFVYSFSEYLLSSHYMPGTVLA